MIRHIVMVKFHEFAEGRTKAENLELVAARLRALPSLISSIRKFEVGINQLESPRAYDLTILADYDDWEGLDFYAKHPEHVSVVEYMSKLREVSHSCDYEV